MKRFECPETYFARCYSTWRDEIPPTNKLISTEPGEVNSSRTRVGRVLIRPLAYGNYLASLIVALEGCHFTNIPAVGRDQIVAETAGIDAGDLANLFAAFHLPEYGAFPGMRDCRLAGTSQPHASKFVAVPSDL